MRTAPPFPSQHRSPRIALWGRAARRAFRPGARGRVLAVFRRSVYVAMEGEAGGEHRLACLGGVGLEPAPLNALCEPGRLPDPCSRPEAPLRPGDAVAVAATGATLVLGGITLDCAAAGTWLPPELGAATPARIRRGLALLQHDGLDAVAPRGLARLLLPAPARRPAGDGSAVEAAGADALVLAAASAAAGSLPAWLEGCPAKRAGSPLPEALAALLGLGEGLTPAGDDWLGGALIALHALGGAGPATALGTALLRQAPARTSVISAAHLRCAATGEGAAALHDVLAALWALDRAALAESLGRLDAIGHTSGWDALAGAAAALSAWARRRPAPGAPGETHLRRGLRPLPPRQGRR